MRLPNGWCHPPLSRRIDRVPKGQSRAVLSIVRPWVSRRVEHGPRVDILAAAVVWTTMCVAAIALAHNAVGFTVAAAACAPGEIAWFVVGAGIVHRIAPPAHRGRYHGIWGLAPSVAAVIAPILARRR